MKILTWNLYSHNPDQIKAILPYLNLYDILCLQEVAYSTIEFLESFYDLNIVRALDYRKKEKDGKYGHFYLVIATRFSISDSHIIQHKTKGNQFEASKKRGWFDNMQTHYADIETEQFGKIRIFNIHLECATNHKSRLSQLEELVPFLDDPDTNSIIVGDFNNFIRPILNPIIGKKLDLGLKDYFVNEGKMIRSWFKKRGFVPSMRRVITYPKFGLDLDHIFLDKSFHSFKGKKIKKLAGSDHYPLEAQIYQPKKLPLDDY